MSRLQPTASTLPTASRPVGVCLPSKCLPCCTRTSHHKHLPGVVAAAPSGPQETGPHSPAKTQPSWWPTAQLNRLTSKLWWNVALPGTASLLQQASAEPSLAAYLTAEFCSITDSWRAQKLDQLPPARQHGMLALADGWRASQEQYHCAAAGNFHSSSSGGGSGSSSSSSSGVASSSSAAVSTSADLLSLVLPDPCSLVIFPCLVGAGGPAALSTWLSESDITSNKLPAQAQSSSSSNTGIPSQVQLDEQHSFVMQQVLELVMCPGSERRVPPFPPTPRPLWLVAVAQRVVAATQAWQQHGLLARQAQAADGGGGSKAQAAQLHRLSDQGLAHMQACVYMPIKDALGCGLGPDLLLASWLYQVVTATMVLYCSNTARNTPDKLIICQAVMADLAAGIEVMQAAHLPLSDHMALYLATQQLAIATDLADLGMQQDEQTAQLAAQVEGLAADIRTQQCGLMLLFDAYCRLGEYHLHVTKDYEEAVHTLELALESFHTRLARTWDGLKEWSDDLSSCALWTYWREVGGASLDVQQLPAPLNRLPGAVHLHREHLRCILHLLVARHWSAANPQMSANAPGPGTWTEAAAHDMLPILTRLLSAAAQQLTSQPTPTPTQDACAAASGEGSANRGTCSDRLSLPELALRYLGSVHEITQLSISSIRQQGAADLSSSAQPLHNATSASSTKLQGKGRDKSARSRGRPNKLPGQPGEDVGGKQSVPGGAAMDAVTAPYSGLGARALSAGVVELYQQYLEQACQQFTEKISNLAADVPHQHAAGSADNANSRNSSTGVPTDSSYSMQGSYNPDAGMQLRSCLGHSRQLLAAWSQRPPSLSAVPGSIVHAALIVSQEVQALCAVYPTLATSPLQDRAVYAQASSTAARSESSQGEDPAINPDMTPLMLPWIWNQSTPTPSQETHEATDPLASMQQLSMEEKCMWQVCMQLRQAGAVTRISHQSLQPSTGPFGPHLDETAAPLAAGSLQSGEGSTQQVGSPAMQATAFEIPAQGHASFDEAVQAAVQCRIETGDTKRSMVWLQLLDVHIAQLTAQGRISRQAVQQWVAVTQASGALSTLSAATWVETWLHVGEAQAAQRAYIALLDMCQRCLSQLRTQKAEEMPCEQGGEETGNSRSAIAAGFDAEVHYAGDILQACTALVRDSKASCNLGTHGDNGAISSGSIPPLRPAGGVFLHSTDLVGCVSQALQVSSMLHGATAAALQQQLLVACAPSMRQDLHQAVQQAARAGCRFHGDAIASLLQQYLAKHQLTSAVHTLQAVLQHNSADQPSRGPHAIPQGTQTHGALHVTFSPGFTAAVQNLISRSLQQQETVLVTQLLELMPEVPSCERMALLGCMCQQALRHNRLEWLTASLPTILGPCQYDGGLGTPCDPQQLLAETSSMVTDVSDEDDSMVVQQQERAAATAVESSIAFRLVGLLTASGVIAQASNQRQLLQLLHAVLQHHGQPQRLNQLSTQAGLAGAGMAQQQQQQVDTFVDHVLETVLSASLLDLGAEAVQLAASFDQLSSGTLSKLLQHALARELSIHTQHNISEDHQHNITHTNASTGQHSPPSVLQNIIRDLRLYLHPRTLNAAIDELITTSHMVYRGEARGLPTALHVLEAVGNSLDYTPSTAACACLIQASYLHMQATTNQQQQQQQLDLHESAGPMVPSQLDAPTTTALQQGSQVSNRTHKGPRDRSSECQQQDRHVQGGSTHLIAPVLVMFLQSAQLPALIHLLQASVELATRTQPTHSSNSRSGSGIVSSSSSLGSSNPTQAPGGRFEFAHHLAACIYAFEQLNSRLAQLGPTRASRYLASRNSTPALGSTLHASTCAELLLLLTQEAPGDATGPYGRLTSATPTYHNSPVVLPQRGSSTLKQRTFRTSTVTGRSQQQQGKQREEPSARVLLLTSVYEQSLAWFGEQLISASPPLVPLAVCQAYLQQRNLDQAVSVGLMSPPALAYLIASPEVRYARSLPAQVLFALVQQAASLQNVPLLEQALQLTKEQGQMGHLLSCLDKKARANLLLQLLRQPPETDMVLQLVSACIRAPASKSDLSGWAPQHRSPLSQGAQAHSRGIDLGFTKEMWMDIAQAAVQVATRASTTTRSTVCAVQVAMACATQLPQHQAAPIRLLAAAVALSGSPPHTTQLAAEALDLVDDAMFTPQATSQAAAAPHRSTQTVSTPLASDLKQFSMAGGHQAVVGAGLVLLNQTAGVRSEELGPAAPGMTRVAAQVMNYLQGLPVVQQTQLLSQAAHRAVISLLCAEHDAAAALKAYDMWVEGRQGARLARSLQESLLVCAAQQLQWRTAVNLSNLLLGPVWRWQAITTSPAARARWMAMSRTQQCAHLAALAAGQSDVKGATELIPCIHDAGDIMTPEQWAAIALAQIGGTTTEEVGRAAAGGAGAGSMVNRFDANPVHPIKLPVFLAHALLQGLLQPNACSRSEAYWMVAWLHSHILGAGSGAAEWAQAATDVDAALDIVEAVSAVNAPASAPSIQTTRSNVRAPDASVASTLRLMHDVLRMLSIR